MYTWNHPIQLRKLLENCGLESAMLPPDSRSVYLITLHDWQNSPDIASHPLYVGGNKNPDLFSKRVGEVIAAALGFDVYHSGGRKLYQWCKNSQINPIDLYISWAMNVKCHRCAEINIYHEMKHYGTLLNKYKPTRCPSCA